MPPPYSTCAPIHQSCPPALLPQPFLGYASSHVPVHTVSGTSPGAMGTLTAPSNDRFQNHVGFDNLPIGEATKNNTPSFTLTVKHKGYRAGRRSRTFMVGVDEHAYSDYALQWLLDELVDDGDEIVCVRVVEKDVRLGDKQYQDEGKAIMQSILDKNGANRALSFVLEYAIGKLHGTFQKLVSCASALFSAYGEFDG
jgi:hypothetical protein